MAKLVTDKTWLCLFAIVVTLLSMRFLAIHCLREEPQIVGVYQDEFPLTIDLNRTVFSIGEKISFDATITNSSGKAVSVATDGCQPHVFFALCPFDSLINHTAQSIVRQDFLFEDGKTITRTQELWVLIPGVYTLAVHYEIVLYDDTSLDYGVSHQIIRGSLGDITILVL